MLGKRIENEGEDVANFSSMSTMERKKRKTAPLLGAVFVTKLYERCY